MNYINDIPILLIFITLVCYIPLRIIYLKFKKIVVKNTKEIAYLLLIAFIESLLYLTLFPSGPITSNSVAINLIPFQTIGLYINFQGDVRLQMINLLGNIVVFIPIGIFAPLLLKKITFLKVLFIGFSSTLFIEIMQLILSINGIVARSFDVDDLILNTIGVLIGFFIWLISHDVKKYLLRK